MKSQAVDRLLKRVTAFTLAGQWDKAEIILDKLIAGRPWDKAMLLARADVKKKRWIAAGCDDFHLLAEAIKHYSRCALITGTVEAGINTATLMLLAGREEEALVRAEELALHCRKLIMEKDVKKESYLAVVIAEIHMINGRFHHAETWYKTAFADRNTMPDHVLINMNLLLEHHVPDTDVVRKIRKAVGA